MSEIITAIYENGVLHPLTPLPLQEHSCVRLQILTEDPATDAEQVVQSLVAAGLVTPPPRRNDVGLKTSVPHHSTKHQATIAPAL